jgi:hypothetical protein
MNFSEGISKQLNQNIDKGDTVQIVGKDEFKGYYGTVTKVKQISGECIFTVELEANGSCVERFQDSLKKEYVKTRF